MQDTPSMLDNDIMRRRLHELDERVKELNCLYDISKLVEKPDNRLEDILQGVVNIIPQSWQYPEITCARITLEYHDFRSERFRETQWCQASEIFVSGEPQGVIEVYYLERRPDSNEGPFLKEERNLLNVIAERLGNIVAQKQAERALIQMQSELEQKARRLEESNTALTYLLEHQESERNKLEENILHRLKVLVVPYLEKLKTSTRDETQNMYLKVIERNLHEVTKQFSPDVESFFSQLAPVEQQIALLIKDNKSSKDIARLLDMSVHTVFFYRKNIRRKLRLQGQQINLKAYLRSLR